MTKTIKAMTGPFLESDPVAMLVALGLLLAALAAAALLRRLAKVRLNRWAQKDGSRLDPLLADMLLGSLYWLLNLFAAWFFCESLFLGAAARSFLDHLFLILFTITTISLLFNGLRLFLDIYLRARGSSLAEHRGKVVLPVVKGVAWVLALAFILDNFGVKVGTILAGLGVAGVAVGFAAQAILGDLFSYFAILFDRPFVIGDFVIVGDLLGTVEHIGLKTSRIRSLSGEQIILPNSDLTGSRVKNYRRMSRRRVVFGFGVLYSTPSHQLEAIPGYVKAIVDETPRATFDRAHFARFGDSSLDFEVVFYVESPDYNEYMDVQQRINLAIVRKFEGEGVGFAFPTRTIHLQQETE
ncbi:mechanosensitive ion channel family protein [Salidesulfovibrio onnuriiensis]|uniref:mechanosensitive ion channel family protein n=1 Tax=Salidesulfovibrio onnuriiensis TaxID=2583823 RepID=UPI001C9CBCB9|nr:mechanosensitive ion channel family protein [Salidesulfovibrio onnuriiensis]